MLNVKFISIVLLVLTSFHVFSQQTDSVCQLQHNSTEHILSSKPGLHIGGYGEVHYNQTLPENKQSQITLDVHRMVLFVGYNFNQNTQFVTEIETEYAKETWVEQAFLQHKLNKYMNFRAGLLLIPMGIINEYHEPTTFNGVERPIIDNKVSPSTWREVGLGLQGNIAPAFIKYQLYAINGISGYDGKGLLNGSQALREGRQKGSKSNMTSPSLAGKAEFYGIKNFNAGLSLFAGKSQSRLYQNLHRDSTILKQKADSSVVGISMIGADLRYKMKGIKTTAQFYYTNLYNTAAYNRFTRQADKNNDLGRAIVGYYAEIGYDLASCVKKMKHEFMPFVRYEAYNLHHKVLDGIKANDKYAATIITTGISAKLHKDAVLKADIQMTKLQSETKFSKGFNAGIGIMF